jgi:hypothetical protein
MEINSTHKKKQLQIQGKIDSTYTVKWKGKGTGEGKLNNNKLKGFDKINRYVN